MVWRIGGGGCLLEVIQKLGKPPRIPQKEPSQHRLKSRGLPIPTRFGGAGTPAGPVAAAADLLPLAVEQQRLEHQQGPGLGLRPDFRHHGTVQIPQPGRPPAMAQPLVQLPHRIPEPGKLEGTEFAIGSGWRHPSQPESGGRNRIPCSRGEGFRRR